MKKVLAVLAAGVASLALITTSGAAQLAPQSSSTAASQSGGEDIVDTAVGAGFDTLATALTAAGLVDTLKGEGPYTVFAPTDEAFAALPEGTLDALLADSAALTDVLLYHVVAGSVPAADVVALDSATTVQGSDVSIEVIDGGVVLNGSVNVTTTDVYASNGVIHVIDSVLLPPTAMEEEAPSADIVDTAVAAGSFTTLATALDAAGLVETLQGDGPFTVFAPTDEAFAALPAGTVEGLLADVPALTDVLLYHVVSGEVLAADVAGLSSATTVQGSPISIEVVDGKVILNGSVEVVTTDIEASNGVIHVIDGVLLPPAETAPTTTAPDPAAAGNAGLGGDGFNPVWLAALGVLAVAGLLAGARLVTAARRS